jgi:hypothetical protein
MTREPMKCRKGASLEYLDKFRGGFRDGPRDLSFEELENPGQDILHVQRLLNRCWDKNEGILVEDERGGVDARQKSCVDDFASTPEKGFLRPNVRLVKLVSTESNLNLMSNAGFVTRLED